MITCMFFITHQVMLREVKEKPHLGLINININSFEVDGLCGSK